MESERSDRVMRQNRSSLEQRKMEQPPHTFHIPVMGTGFTIDTPLKVARYGISSVISLGDDILIEQMRKVCSERYGLPFEPIGDREEDFRVRRITSYLNMMNDQVSQQIETVRRSPFEPDSEITRYFEMLPVSPLKQAYLDMLDESNAETKRQLQDALRQAVRAGDIDVNVMTKVDFVVVRRGKTLGPEHSVVMSAIRGFAQSSLESSVVLSAGMNRRLFGYMAQFDNFFPDSNGHINKKIILKVSDFRSAQVQGRLLARRGLWVSEFRIESGLNCGGHAFATKGHLMGPILEEFKHNRQDLAQEFHSDISETLSGLGRPVPEQPPDTRITVQGGIGTADEDAFLQEHFCVDGTGWGTPFLLVPEAVNVDDAHLQKLVEAVDSDVQLGSGSPLGVPFWTLKTSASEETRRRRIDEGKPGSPCPKGYLKCNTEFTANPICTASRTYQKQKLVELETSQLTPEERASSSRIVLARACICNDLAGGATVKAGVDSDAQTAVCCGPGIIDFSQVASLSEMIDHIYGRCSLMIDAERRHMFVRELELYVDFLRQELEKSSKTIADRTAKYLSEFKQNLSSGIEYYRDLAEHFGQQHRDNFLRDIDRVCEELEDLLSDSKLAEWAAKATA